LQQITHLEIQGGLHWPYLQHNILERLPNLTHLVAGGSRYPENAADDADAAARAIGILSACVLGHRLQSVFAPNLVINHRTHASLSRLPCLSELVADCIDEQWQDPCLLELTSLTRLWLARSRGTWKLGANLAQAELSLEELTNMDLSPATADKLALAAPRLQRLAFCSATSGRGAWGVPVTHAFQNVTHLSIQVCEGFVSVHLKPRFPALEHLAIVAALDVPSDDDADGDDGGARLDIASLLSGLTGLRSLALERLEVGWITPLARDAIAAMTRLEQLGVAVDVDDPASLAWLARVTTAVSLTLAPATATMHDDDSQPARVSLALEAAAHLPRLASLVLMVPLSTLPSAYPTSWELAPFLRFARGTTSLRTLEFRDMPLPPHALLCVLAAHLGLKAVEFSWGPATEGDMTRTAEVADLSADSCSAGGPSMLWHVTERDPWKCRACSWKLPAFEW
jgi:hypothetical protein